MRFNGTQTVCGKEDEADDCVTLIELYVGLKCQYKNKKITVKFHSSYTGKYRRLLYTQERTDSSESTLVFRSGRLTFCVGVLQVDPVCSVGKTRCFFPRQIRFSFLLEFVCRHFRRVEKIEF